MRQSKYILILILAAIVALSGFSCSSEKRDVKKNFIPVPLSETINKTPKASPTTVIKGEAGKPQTIDIFSGKPIVKNVFSDYKGERVYFCCDVEKRLFLKNPALYVEKMKERGIILDTVPS